MNQRAHLRHPVDMPVRLSGGELGDHVCRIGDFCLGGMLIDVEQAPTLSGALRQGDLLTLDVDVEGVRGQRAVSLRARVVRKAGNRIGVAFESPDATSLLALQNHVRASLQDAPAGQQQQASQQQAEKGRHLASALAAEVGSFLQQRMAEFQPAVLEALKAGAERAANDEARFPWIQAARALQQQQQALLDRLIEQATAALRCLAEGQPLPDNQGLDQRQQSQHLSLVDKDRFEDWLTLKVMASRAENHFNDDLLHLQLRLDELFSISLSSRKNPLHPSVLCVAFGDALKILPLKAKTDRPILNCFEKTVIDQLQGLYQQANQLLAGQGVLPDLDVGRYLSARQGGTHNNTTPPAPADDSSVSSAESGAENVSPASAVASQSVGRDSVAAAPVTRDRPAPAEPAVDATAAEGKPPVITEGADDGLAEAEQSGIAGAEGSAEPTRKTGPSLSARQFSLQQHIARHAYQTVRDLLSRRTLDQTRAQLTTAAAPASPAASAPAAPVDQQALRQALGALQQQSQQQDAVQQPLSDRLRDSLRGADGESVPLDTDTEAAVQVVHNLFEGMLANPALSERVRLALRRLEAPFLRLLLDDDAFLVEEQHPARQLLNRIAHLGVRGSANLGNHEGEIDQSINQVLQEFDGDSEVFSKSLSRLDQLADKQRSLYLRNMTRVTESCDGRYQVVLARREANKALERRIGGKRVPKAVLSLIDAGWRELLVQTLLRHGRDSQQWHAALRVIDSMLTAATEVPSQNKLSELLAAIKQGLGQVDETQMQNARLITELRDLLSIKAREKQSAELINVPAGLVDESAAASEESGSEIMQRFQRRARRYEVGDWFAHRENDRASEHLVRLAWHDPDGSMFVFVNHQGMKVTEYSLADFAKHLAASRMQAIDNLDAPAVDRGLEAMVQRVYGQMAHQATHDDLCALINRREFERQLRVRLAEVGANGTLLHIDIDQFKVVNNMGGPQAGDELLLTFTERLKEHFSDNLIGRLGGDEFAVWLESLPDEGAMRVAEQFCQSMPEQRFVCAGKPHSITVSCGVATSHHAGVTAAQLIQTASNACHAAKEAGRNRLQSDIIDSDELSKRDDIIAWISRLNEAIEHNKLLLRCQRIENVSDADALPAYEVLLAIAGERGETIAPAEFLHAAEKYNRMHTVDRWVISNVLRWMHGNPDVVKKLDHLSINLSGHSLNDATLVGFLFEQFQSYPVPRERICFEVTETAAIANLDDAVDFVRELQELGCRFSLDDFGSGLASYGHLKHLPVDYIKIDGSFIRDVANDKADLAMVRSINEMGHLMGKKTIAEYVENDQIRALMAELGVDYVQGFGVEKPRPLDSLV